MKNPTSKQFKRVIDNLDKVLPMATKRGHLDMSKVELADDKEHICGTPMCFAGFYAVANGVFSDDRRMSDYSEGSYLVAEHLGFGSNYPANVLDLRKWAHFNPSLWDNEFGWDMFCRKKAFNHAETLREVRNHLAKVHNRTCKRAKPIPLV